MNTHTLLFSQRLTYLQTQCCYRAQSQSSFATEDSYFNGEYSQPTLTTAGPSSSFLHNTTEQDKNKNLHSSSVKVLIPLHVRFPNLTRTRVLLAASLDSHLPPP